MRLDIQRVDNLNIDRTIASLVSRVVGNRVVRITEAVGRVVGQRLAHDFVDGLLREFEFVTTVTNTNQTGDGGFVTIGGVQHRTVNGLMRHCRIDLDVLSTFEVGLLLTEEAIFNARLL